MTIHLYNISDNPNKVKKSADKSGGKIIDNAIFKDDDTLNVLNPTVVLNLNSEISNNLHFNYVYIPKTTRFYYITNISMRGGLAYIDTKVDVLNSFSDDILKSSQYIARSESVINGKIVDSMLPIHSDHLFYIEPFGDSVYDESCNYCILETAGKGGV